MHHVLPLCYTESVLFFADGTRLRQLVWSADVVTTSSSKGTAFIAKVNCSYDYDHVQQQKALLLTFREKIIAVGSLATCSSLDLS